MANEQKEPQEKLVESVLKRVDDLAKNGAFILPEDYAVENALRSAHFIIGETVNKDGKSALETCDPVSISKALFNMVCQGLSPNKAQCHFIVHGNKLIMRRSYPGTIAVAKRVANVKDCIATVIHQGDVFQFQVINGRKEVIKHVQTLESLDSEITGAYAVAEFNDGRFLTDIMTMKEIKTSWKMSSNQNGNKLQNDFSGEACKRTVINRCLKQPINSSTDANLYQRELEENEVEETTHEVVNENKTRKVVSLPPATVKQTIPVPEKKPEPEIAQNTMFDSADEEEQELPPLERD